MKLLILTQKIDKQDLVLGFFHGWVLELSKKFEKVSVICLEKGAYDLPGNVQVFSLGKESGRSKVKYVKNFFNLILGLNKEYDSVFVHMNQEYILLGGFFWRIMRKKVYFWRNHPKGSLLTNIAVLLSNKVFCTSKASFTAKFKKTSLMPVGVDTSIFNTESRIKNYELCKGKILFLGRIAPIKNEKVFIEALNILNKKSISFEASVYGDPLPKDQEYYEWLKEKVKDLNLENKMTFYKGVPNNQTPEVYGDHDICVNLTPTGSFDKTIIEAAMCGAIPIMANKSLEGEIDDKLILDELSPENLAERIEFWLKTKESKKAEVSKRIRNYVLENHSLDALMKKLCIEIKK